MMNSKRLKRRLKTLSLFLDWAHNLSGERYDFRGKKTEMLDAAKKAGTPIAAFDHLPAKLKKELCYRWADYSQGAVDNELA